MVVLYRSGGMPERKDLLTKSAVWFDQVSNNLSLEIPSPRTDSIFACLNVQDAEGWVGWREDKNLDSDIWKIVIPDDVQVYAHKVQTYEDARYIHSLIKTEGVTLNVQPEELVASYWVDKVLVEEGTVLSFDYFWEVLIPYDVALVSGWNCQGMVYS